MSTRGFLVALPLMLGTLTFSAATADTYEYIVDPQVHVSCCTDMSSWLEVPVSAGNHTICLESGPMPSCPNNGWGADVILVPSGLGGNCHDYAWFTLNGEGDCVELYFESDGSLTMGINDGYVWDNQGEIVVTIDGVGHTVDLQEHNTTTTDREPWLEVEVPEEGRWRVTLVEGPSPSCPDNGWGADLLMVPSGLGGNCSDYAWTSLNGQGDSVELEFEHPGFIQIGLEDGYAGDNQGLITIQLDGPLDPPYPWLHVVDPQVHVSCCTDMSDWLEVPVSAGNHTICLESGPMPPCPGNGWGADVIVVPSGLGGDCHDYAWFTLNGEGDCVELYFESDGSLNMGIIDGFVADNQGEIVVTIDGIGHTVDPQEHYTDTTDIEPWLQVEIPEAGVWVVSLLEGPDPPCPDNGWGADLLMVPSGLGGDCSDYAWVSLNGETDSVELEFEHPGFIKIGMEDGYVPDNQGEILISVLPLSASAEDHKPELLSPLSVNAWPSPATGPATIQYELGQRVPVTISILDAAGRLVKVLESSTRPAGTHIARWDGRNTAGTTVSSGVYYCRICAGSTEVVRAVVRVN